MPLFTTINEIKKYAGITSATHFDSIKPDISDVEELHIAPILGNSLYTSLLSAYTTSAIVSGSLTEKLLFKCQKALINIALEQYSSLAQLDFSDSGIRQMEDGTYKSPKQWQIDDLREYFYMKGYRALDELLTFLEQNKASFASWTADTAAYTINKKFIVSDTDTFQGFYDINKSRLTYIALQPEMRIVEIMHIMPNISEGLFTRLKTKIKENNVTGDLAEIMEMLQLAVTHFTIAGAIDKKIVTVSQEGIFTRNYRGTMDNSRERIKSDLADREIAKEKCIKIAEKAMENLRAYLNANATAATAATPKFTEYFESSLYVAPTDGTKPQTYENLSSDKIFLG